MNGQTDKLTDRQKGREPEIQIGRLKEGQTERCMD
jgi:hypothetical protein